MELMKKYGNKYATHVGDRELLLQSPQHLLSLRVRADSLALVLLDAVLRLRDHELQPFDLAVVVGACKDVGLGLGDGDGDGEKGGVSVHPRHEVREQAGWAPARPLRGEQIRVHVGEGRALKPRIRVVVDVRIYRKEYVPITSNLWGSVARVMIPYKYEHGVSVVLYFFQQALLSLDWRPSIDSLPWDRVQFVLESGRRLLAGKGRLATAAGCSCKESSSGKRTWSEKKT